MKKRIAALTFVVLTGLCGGLAAQPTQQEGRSGAKPEARRPSHRPVGRFAKPDRQLELLDEKLQLDEDQKARIKPILEAQFARIREIQVQNARTPEEMEAWKKVRQGMEEAMKSGDQEKMQELRRQSEQLHQEREAKRAPARKQIEEAEQTTHDDVAKLLRPDQQQRFEEFWRERLARRTPRTGPVRNPRALRELVKRLPDLTSDQSKQIDALFEEYQKSMRSAPEGKEATNPPAKPDGESRGVAFRQRQEKLFSDVMALLTPEQAAKIEESLKGRRRRPVEPGQSEGGRKGSDKSKESLPEEPHP